MPNETEFERRTRLMDKCLDLANLAFEQKDVETGGQMLRKALDLLVTQLDTIELIQPGFKKSLKDNPEWVRFAKTIQEMTK